MGSTETSTKPSFAEALSLWGKIGVLSFGGPAGQIALMIASWSMSAAGSKRNRFCMP